MHGTPPFAGQENFGFRAPLRPDPPSERAGRPNDRLSIRLERGDAGTSAQRGQRRERSRSRHGATPGEGPEPDEVRRGWDYAEGVRDRMGECDEAPRHSAERRPVRRWSRPAVSSGTTAGGNAVMASGSPVPAAARAGGPNAAGRRVPLADATRARITTGVLGGEVEAGGCRWPRAACRCHEQPHGDGAQQPHVEPNRVPRGSRLIQTGPWGREPPRDSPSPTCRRSRKSPRAQRTRATKPFGASVCLPPRRPARVRWWVCGGASVPRQIVAVRLLVQARPFSYIGRSRARSASAGTPGEPVAIGGARGIRTLIARFSQVLMARDFWLSVFDAQVVTGIYSCMAVPASPQGSPPVVERSWRRRSGCHFPSSANGRGDIARRGAEGEERSQQQVRRHHRVGGFDLGGAGRVRPPSAISRPLTWIPGTCGTSSTSPDPGHPRIRLICHTAWSRWRLGTIPTSAPAPGCRCRRRCRSRHGWPIGRSPIPGARSARAARRRPGSARFVSLPPLRLRCRACQRRLTS